MRISYLYRFIFSSILLLFVQFSQAQYKLSGTVYDSSRLFPVESVSVLSTSGKGAVTNANGHYEIIVDEKDSVWFSYLNKPTVKFPVAKIADFNQFNIALQVNIPVLREITIRPRNYRLDSIQNRLDYEKIFNYKKPSLGTMTNIGPNGAGIDINELIRAFQFRKNKNMLKFQQRLLLQEQEKFIDHRFNKALVRRLTQLDSTALENFMLIYRPSYEFALYTSDFEFQSYIKDSFTNYQARRGELKKEPTGF